MGHIKPALSEQGHDYLVGLIYDCVAESDNWNIFLSALTDSLGVTSALVQVQDLQDKGLGFCACHGFAPGYFKSYEDNYIASDPLVELVATKVEVGHFIKRSDFISDEEYFQSDFHRNYSEADKSAYVYGGLLARNGQRVVAFAVHNSLQLGDFTEAQDAAMQRLAPHMQRAFELSRILDSMEKKLSCMHQVVEHDAFGIIVVDAQAKVLTINGLAKKLVAKGELSISSERLLFARGDEQANFKQALQGLMDEVETEESACLTLSRKLGGQAYTLLLSPVDSGGVCTGLIGQNQAAVLFIYDPEQSVLVSPEILRFSYKLSGAEIRLAQSLAEGICLDSCAERFFVSKNTVRAQLRSIFSKTHTHSQPDLVRLLLSLPKTMPLALACG